MLLVKCMMIILCPSCFPSRANVHANHLFTSLLQNIRGHTDASHFPLDCVASKSIPAMLSIEVSCVSNQYRNPCSILGNFHDQDPTSPGPTLKMTHIGIFRSIKCRKWNLGEKLCWAWRSGVLFGPCLFLYDIVLIPAYFLQLLWGWQALTSLAPLTPQPWPIGNLDQVSTPLWTPYCCVVPLRPHLCHHE